MDNWLDESFDVKKEEQKLAKDLGVPNNEDNRGFTTLLYGDTGCGKTYIAHTFPEPILIIDTENRAFNTKKYNFPNKKIDIFEPMLLRAKYFENMDLFDEHESIEVISKKVIELLNGNKYKTIVIDSVTDLWSWLQQWMFIELSKLYSKDGKKRGDLIQMRVSNQLDWKICNRRSYDILNALKSLNKSGVNIIFTAREEVVPEYLKDEKSATKNKIRCQKDVPFLSDITFQLKKEFKQGGWTYNAYCEKLSGLPILNQPIINLDYYKLIGLIEQQRKSIENGK